MCVHFSYKNVFSDYNMFSSNINIKLHILLIVCITGVAYFMYQLYNECKSLERELIISKKQISFLTSNKDVLTCKEDENAKNETDIGVVSTSEIDSDSDSEIEVNVNNDEIKSIYKKLQEINKSKTKENVQDSCIVDTCKEIVQESCVANTDTCQEKEQEEQDKDELEESEESEEHELRNVVCDTGKPKIRFTKHSLGKWKLSDLKDYLFEKSIDNRGTKSELIKRILDNEFTN